MRKRPTGVMYPVSGTGDDYWDDVYDVGTGDDYWDEVVDAL